MSNPDLLDPRQSSKQEKTTEAQAQVSAVQPSPDPAADPITDTETKTTETDPELSIESEKTAETLSAQPQEMESSSPSETTVSTESEDAYAAYASEAESSDEPQTTKEKPVRKLIGSCLFGALAWIAPLVLAVIWFLQSLPSVLKTSLIGLYDTARHFGGLTEGTVSSVIHADAFNIPVFQIISEKFSSWSSIVGEQAIAAIKLDQCQFFGPLLQKSSEGFTLAVSSGLLVLAAWLLGLAAGGRKTGLASGLACIVSLAFIRFPVSASGELICAAASAAASAAFCRGWKKSFAPLTLAAAFTLTAVSAVLNGVIGLLTPLLVSIVFLVARGDFRRIGRADGSLCFGLMLILIGMWCAYLVFFVDGGKILGESVEQQFVAPIRAVIASGGKKAWIPLISFAVLTLPWLFSLPFACTAQEKNRSGLIWIWLNLVVLLIGLCLLGASPVQFAIVLPVVSALSAYVLTGSLGGIYTGLSALFFILVGCCFAAANIAPMFTDAFPQELSFLQLADASWLAIAVQSGSWILFGLILFGLSRIFSSDLVLLIGSLLFVAVILLLVWNTGIPASETITSAEGFISVR
ncbi:MAG: hypothetical protein PUB69_06920 [Desulfovibrionaceae bacterium]|nr:hypothetical protein [Desulfovibrionaceae bacterium]